MFFGLSLFAPEKIIIETINHKEEIINKSGISEDDFEVLMNLLALNINIVPKEEFSDYKEKAFSLAKHPEDAPFIPLALYKNFHIWSDDRGLKEQSEVKIFFTNEIIDFLGFD